jgi:hypothetical protein
MLGKYMSRTDTIQLAMSEGHFERSFVRRTAQRLQSILGEHVYVSNTVLAVTSGFFLFG